MDIALILQSVGLMLTTVIIALTVLTLWSQTVSPRGRHSVGKHRRRRGRHRRLR